ncbi:acyl-CoA/acyl-ACP dehydrogenase [Rhodococcus sp. 14C212]|uniref:acyl-CoA dehydrogenase family protein n=1 Tax=Rhodococcus sp. 14C212 TaxID=2711209 RepID=UPI0013EDBEC2|nr:acyl-CoA dehydrogenase family protein [Rhodococcus sp. 14C212]NGP04390.1 acyl-CoA/acyl-ACP dehydrogenase [Rhodococcus sp. 14C212]
MDFELDEDLTSVQDLASQLFRQLAPVERVVEVEQNEGGFDATLWGALADAGLLGIAVPEESGGAGMGLLGLSTVLEQQGRHVAPVPLWSVTAAASAIARFGTAEQVERLVPGIVDGSRPVVAAFDAPYGELTSLSAVSKGDDLVVSGTVAGVPAAAVAAATTVPVRCDDGSLAVVVIPTGADGVTVEPVAATDRGSFANVRFDDVVVPAVDRLPGDGAETVAWVRRRIQLALAAVQLGVCEQALQTTAEYTSQRIQFGRPLSTNQAVAVRAADAYLDTEAIRLTTRRAAWLLDAGREQEAESAVLVAKWWASRGGLRVVHATQHLHGGIGADVDYPIHRYFLWGRQLCFTLGGADATAAALGDVLGSAPRIGAPV